MHFSAPGHHHLKMQAEKKMKRGVAISHWSCEGLKMKRVCAVSYLYVCVCHVYLSMHAICLCMLSVYACYLSMHAICLSVWKIIELIIVIIMCPQYAVCGIVCHISHLCGHVLDIVTMLLEERFSSVRQNFHIIDDSSKQSLQEWPY